MPKGHPGLLEETRSEGVGLHVRAAAVGLDSHAMLQTSGSLLHCIADDLMRLLAMTKEDAHQPGAIVRIT